MGGPLDQYNCVWMQWDCRFSTLSDFFISRILTSNCCLQVFFLLLFLHGVTLNKIPFTIFLMRAARGHFVLSILGCTIKKLNQHIMLFSRRKKHGSLPRPPPQYGRSATSAEKHGKHFASYLYFTSRSYTVISASLINSNCVRFCSRAKSNII